MKTYDLIRDDLVKVWRRTHYSIEAESLNEAVNLVLDGEGEVFDSELLFETEEIINPEDVGFATIEIQDDHYNELYTNYTNNDSGSL